MSDSSNAVSRLVQSTFSYNGNVMLAALIALLLVILFVLLLHLYAKWFLAQARTRRRSSITVSHVLGPTRFPAHFDSLPVDSVPTKGLDPSDITAIPVFIYEAEKGYKIGSGTGLECVICLSAFEESEIGRILPKCGHAFHVECIDMWLSSHSNCPTCRAPAVCEAVSSDGRVMEEVWDIRENDQLEIEIDGQVYEGDITNANVTGNHDQISSSVCTCSCSSSASSGSSTASVGCSLKRMLSRNRSEIKVFASFNGNHQLDA